jgi:hypothetical protein
MGNGVFLHFEGPMNGLGERLALKRNKFRKRFEIVEVLHTRVGNAEFDHVS